MNNFIIDGNNLYYRSLYACIKHTGADVNTEVGRKEIIKKFFIDLVSMANRIPRVRLIIVFDSMHNWREEVYPKYKLNRKGANFKPDEFANVKSVLFEVENMCIKSGLDVVKVGLCEGDDVIWYITQVLYKDKMNIVFSMDADITQLINSKTRVYNGKDILTEKDIDTTFVRFSKILLGDKSDNIPKAIKQGVGQVAVKNAYGKYNEGLSFLNSKISFDKLNLTLKNSINFEDVILNSKLVMLHEAFIPIHIKAALKRRCTGFDVNPSPLRLSMFIN